MSQEQINVWNFEVKDFPKPPTGFNQGAKPPPPELVQTALTRLVDPSSEEFGPWVRLLYSKMGSMQKVKWCGQQATRAMNHRILNLDSEPWLGFGKVAGKPPPSTDVPIYARAQWKLIYQNNNQGGGADKHKIETKWGVTTTESETSSFAAKIGINASAGFGPFSVALNTEFTTSKSGTKSIELITETTVTEEMTVPADTYVEVWQLSMIFQAEDGPSIEQAMQSYQDLSYPSSPSVSDQEIDEEVTSLMSATAGQ